MLQILLWIITTFENSSSEEVDSVSKETIIPVYEWTGFSLAMHILLPVAGLALIWGQRGIFSKLLLQLDRSCVSVYCPSLSKREKLLKWASTRLPLTWSSQARTLSSGIPELWKDGSLLCTLINSVVPGACPNPHRHWRKPPTHAQALAYKYLGLTPMFSDEELSGVLSINQERNFIHYLNELQQAINKWPTNNETNRKFSSQYVARGMGLYTGEQHRKTVFYIYPDVATKKRSNILMYIRGPYSTHGKATIPPFHSLKTIPVVNVLQDQLEASKTLPFTNNEQKSFLKTISLDFTSLLNVDNNHAPHDDIPIQIDMEIDRAKVTYIPNNTGMYEITLISDGELLRGFPYNVRVFPNTTDKIDSFSIDDTVETNEKITFTKRKIISKVIDCIDEQIVIDNNNKDLTITAVTQHNNEMLKTEINCCLEDTTKNTTNQNDPIEQISQIAQEWDQNKNKTDWKIDPHSKIVKNVNQAKNEIINSIQELTSTELTQKKNTKPVQRITSKIHVEIATPSPICSDHIVPEEVAKSLAEKRKTFAKQDSIESCYSSFSELTENEQESSFTQLSVLNILKTLKQSHQPEPYSLSSTASLPNMASLESVSFEQNFGTVKACKDYWERMSSKSSSSLSISSDTVQQKKLTDVNVFNKLNQNEKYGNEKKRKIFKSSNNVCLVPYEATPGSIKKFKSFDDSLEDCSRLTIEERKKILLKETYGEEKHITQLNFKNNLNQKNKISPTAGNVKLINQNLNVLDMEKKEKEEKNKNEAAKSAIVTQFKRALKIFKNLENNNINNSDNNKLKKSNKKDDLHRSYSLDSPKKNLKILNNKSNSSSKGGSLNLPNISERFSINNLYKDVFGNKESSFRGTPNKNGVIKSLASMSNKEPNIIINKINGNEEEDKNDDIKYNLFVNKSKTKQRKSIKTLFDVHY